MPKSAGAIRAGRLCPAGSILPGGLEKDTSRNIFDKWFERPGVRGRRRRGMSKVGGDSKSTLYCSFCGKSQHEVRKLIAAPTVFICDESVALSMAIIPPQNKPSLVTSRPAI